MNLTDLSATTEAFIGVCTVAVLLVSGYKVLWYGKRGGRPGWIKGFLQDVRGFRDAILGREEQRDSITREVVQPALPGIGVRMAHQESQMAEVTRALTTLVDQDRRLNDHEGRIVRLEGAADERMLTKIESIAAFDAMAKAHDARPDFIDGEAD